MANAKWTTLDDFDLVEFNEPQKQNNSSQPQLEKRGFCLSLDMLEKIDEEDVKDILSGCEEYGLDRDKIIIERENAVIFKERTTETKKQLYKNPWTWDIRTEYYKKPKGPKVDFTVAYVGELSPDKAKFLYAEPCFSPKGTKYYILRGRVYFSGFKMRNPNQAHHMNYDVIKDDFIKFNEEIFNQLVENYNNKIDKNGL